MTCFVGNRLLVLASVCVFVLYGKIFNQNGIFLCSVSIIGISCFIGANDDYGSLRDVLLFSPAASLVHFSSVVFSHDSPFLICPEMRVYVIWCAVRLS